MFFHNFVVYIILITTKPTKIQRKTFQTTLEDFKTLIRNSWRIDESDQVLRWSGCRLLEVVSWPNFSIFSSPQFQHHRLTPVFAQLLTQLEKTLQPKEIEACSEALDQLKEGHFSSVFPQFNKIENKFHDKFEGARRDDMIECAQDYFRKDCGKEVSICIRASNMFQHVSGL